jgi:hypothetical protein
MSSVEKYPVCVFWLQLPLCEALTHWIRHDWADGDCIKILKNTKKAMKTSSRVLIRE